MLGGMRCRDITIWLDSDAKRRAYQDVAEGVMQENPDGSGRFLEVVLQPEIAVPPATDLDQAHALHAAANTMCFIANSVNFPVRHEPVFVTAAR